MLACNMLSWFTTLVITHKNVKINKDYKAELLQSSCLFVFLCTEPGLLCLHQQLLMDKRVGLKRYELNGRKVLFYFDEVSSIQIPHCCVNCGCAHVNSYCMCDDDGWGQRYSSVFAQGWGEICVYSMCAYLHLSPLACILFFASVFFSVFVTPTQIPSQCMTCVAFQAVREYIVGKTAPVPVKIYDYYEPGVPLMNILSTAL